MIVDVRHHQDFQRLLEYSKTQPVLIFKHSTQCSISDQVYEEINQFVESVGDITCGVVLVIERRDLSDAIAAELEIRHQSPQVIVIRDGKPKWDASHWSITADALTRAFYAESPHQ
jgi:monothiol bacilliredoxin